jgi:hypothetical protein
LNVEAPPLIHVKIKIEQGQGLGLGLGLRLNEEWDDLFRNKELIKQVVAILAFRPNVKIEIIDQIYVNSYKKCLCFCWFEHYTKGNFRVKA